jgi:hypothetical protein
VEAVPALGGTLRPSTARTGGSADAFRRRADWGSGAIHCSRSEEFWGMNLFGRTGKGGNDYLRTLERSAHSPQACRPRKERGVVTERWHCSVKTDTAA